MRRVVVLETRKNNRLDEKHGVATDFEPLELTDNQRVISAHDFVVQPNTRVLRVIVEEVVPS